MAVLRLSGYGTNLQSTSGIGFSFYTYLVRRGMGVDKFGLAIDEDVPPEMVYITPDDQFGPIAE